MYIKDKDGNYVPTPSSKGADGREVNLRVANNYIQWRYPDTEWTNLVPLASLKGDPGTDGIDGREVHMRVVSDALQWRLGDSDTWQTLMSLTSIADGASFGGMVVDKTLVLAETEDSSLSAIETRTTIANGDLEIIAREHIRTIVVFDVWPMHISTPANYGLPADIELGFILINGPVKQNGTKNYLISYPNATVSATAFVFECPQTLMDGKDIYMRRLSYWDEKDEDNVSHWKFDEKDWTKMGSSSGGSGSGTVITLRNWTE